MIPIASRGGWWSDGDALPRVLADLISAEAQALRPGAGAPWAGVPDPDTSLDARGVGFDSLEMLSLAGAVSEALCLHRAGLEDGLLARRRFGDWCAVAAASLDHFSAELVVRTGGSTGEPRRFTHTLAALTEEAAALAAILPAGRRRVLAAVPSHHIYGFLFTVLLPRALARDGVPLPVLDVRASLPGRVPALVQPGDLVVGHPAFWAALSRGAPAGTTWPGDVAATTSTAPCPAELAEALGAAGLGAWLEVYGSSETAGLGHRSDPRAPFALLPHWHRTGTDSVARDGATPAPVPVSPPDRLDWVDGRHFRVSGRRDGAVQVGGTNVFPARVAAVLERSPLVAAAAVRPMRAHEGQRLKAFVVPRDPDADPVALRRTLDGLAQEWLSPAEMPRAYEFGPALPVDALGKSADWPMRAAGPNRPGAPAIDLHFAAEPLA